MTGKSKRGFASMDPSRQREIASRGGRAAHAKGTAHEWSPDEARVAGRKGGEVVSRDREHMAAIGREGGEARGRNSARLKSRQRGSLPEGVADRESAMFVSREGMPNATGAGNRSSQPAAYEEEELRP
jgi:general stress protein YciG